MEINISVIALFVFYQSTKNLRRLSNLFAFNTAFGKLTYIASCTRCEIPVVTQNNGSIVGVVVLLFYVHGKHIRSCRDGQLT